MKILSQHVTIWNAVVTIVLVLIVPWVIVTIDMTASRVRMAEMQGYKTNCIVGYAGAVVYAVAIPFGLVCVWALRRVVHSPIGRMVVGVGGVAIVTVVLYVGYILINLGFPS